MKAKSYCSNFVQQVYDIFKQNFPKYFFYEPGRGTFVGDFGPHEADLKWESRSNRELSPQL